MNRRQWYPRESRPRVSGVYRQGMPAGSGGPDHRPRRPEKEVRVGLSPKRGGQSGAQLGYRSPNRQHTGDAVVLHDFKVDREEHNEENAHSPLTRLAPQMRRSSRRIASISSPAAATVAPMSRRPRSWRDRSRRRATRGPCTSSAGQVLPYLGQRSAARYALAAGQLFVAERRSRRLPWLAWRGDGRWK